MDGWMDGWICKPVNILLSRTRSFVACSHPFQHVCFLSAIQKITSYVSYDGQDQETEVSPTRTVRVQPLLQRVKTSSLKTN